MRLCLVSACVLCWALLGNASQAHAATLTVLWDRSPDPAAAGYVVSYGTESGGYTARVVAGAATSVTLTGLADGTTYYVVVQSYSSEGAVGAPSVEVFGRTPAPVADTLSMSCSSPVLTSPDGNPVSVTLLPVVLGGRAPVTVRCSPASGSLFAVGSTGVSCSATDATGDTASCTSAVVVLGPRLP